MGAGEARGQRLLELKNTPEMARDNLAMRSLQKNGRSNHRHEDHYGSHDQPISPDSPCPRRPIGRLLRIVCGSLGCPSGLFFLLGFMRFGHGLPPTQLLSSHELHCMR